ncbi:hypothetical protein [Tahibacter caeni]|uniref:hypothetical protein n=1 Tax=Tahibacter caeni TaxID=1453545 RepID=UPI0021478663|nr:hypothetical protein [Tahibacter caeni]
MTVYSLQLLINSQDLAMLYAAGQRITLAKTTSSGAPNVAWLVFDPFQSNTVQWTEDYGLYASTTSVQYGAMITQLAQSGMPASSGASYSFTAAATFNGPFPGGAPGTYRVQNDMPTGGYPMLTFGLIQSAQVNGVQLVDKPLSAWPVLATQMLSLTPTNSVYIWLQSMFGSSTIVTQITGRVTVARFGGNVTDLTLVYDASSGLFVQQSGQDKAQAEETHVELVKPGFY